MTVTTQEARMTVPDFSGVTPDMLRAALPTTGQESSAPSDITPEAAPSSQVVAEHAGHTALAGVASESSATQAHSGMQLNPQTYRNLEKLDTIASTPGHPNGHVAGALHASYASQFGLK